VDPNAYRFRSTWRIAAPVADVYDALVCLRDYPTWWPEVREVTQHGEDAASLRCRSLLPYDLVFTTRQSRRDRDAGVLEAHMEGDLAGFSRWTIAADGRGTAAVFDEEVEVHKQLLRTLAPVARPAFKVNHALMMRHGERGLRTFVAGFQLGRGR
jgi:hypothetical protein